MSVQAVAWVLERTIPDPAAKLVMISLANAYNGKTGRCFPPIEQVAEETSCSRSTVKRKLHWLQDMGWIRIHESFDGSGRQLPNSYSIRFEDVEIEGFSVNPHQSNSEPGEGFNCEPPLKEPEERTLSILSEASSDHARRPATYPELFEAFWSEYPRTPNMSKKEAFDAWRKLPEQDRQACHAGIAGYVAFLKTKPDLETIHACRFISKRRFEGFQPAASRDNDEQWTKRLSVARYRHQWSTAEWGPSPNHPGCRVPQHLIQPGDGDGWAEWKSEAA